MATPWWEDNSAREHVSRIGLIRRQTLHATVIHACKNCGAPGYWHNTPDVNVGCFAPEKVTRLGHDPVGETCPNCGADRDVIEDRGEIWRKEYRVWHLIRDQIKGLFRRSA